MQAAAVELNEGTYQQPSKMTVGEWMDIWARDYLGGVKPMTVVNYEQHIKNQIRPALGAIKLEALNTHTIQSFNDLRNPMGRKRDCLQRPSSVSQHSARGAATGRGGGVHPVQSL